MAFKPLEAKYEKFTSYKVNIRPIEFAGKPPSLSAFPEWVWYTPAPAFLWGGLSNTILSGLQQELNIEYYQGIFNTVIFSGFENGGNSFWNHTLWAAKQEEWGILKDALLGVTNVNTEHNLMVKYGLQEVLVYDPIAVQNSNLISPETPVATIYAFGVMSNKSTIAFNPATGVSSHPHVYTIPPDPGIVELSNQLLKGQTDIGGVAEQFRDVCIDGSEYKKYDQ
tara:strand:- start:14498 stop:15169 length:672 start_codon:yes stop_codon:yes gene_type:complete